MVPSRWSVREHIDLDSLEGRVAEFNQWRTVKPDERWNQIERLYRSRNGHACGSSINLSGIDLSELGSYQSAELDLRNCKLAGANLDRNTFHNVRFGQSLSEVKSLSYVQFHDCNLRYVDLSGKELREVQFIRCNLDYSKFNRSRLINVSMEKCSAEGAQFSHVQAAKIRIHKCCSDYANFTWAMLKKSDLRFTSFVQASFVGADLRKSDFSYTDLSQAEFSSARLYDARLDNAYTQTAWASRTSKHYRHVALKLRKR